jgi:hypothetical protein
VKRCEVLRDLRAGKIASVMAPTISPAAAKQALVQAGGSVTGAVRTLGIASGTLRGLVRAQPLLADVVFEQIKREIDAARQVLRDGLDSDSALTRMRAAAYILRHTEAGRPCGWGRHPMPCRETGEPQDVTLKWVDYRPNPKASRRIVESEHDS